MRPIERSEKMTIDEIRRDTKYWQRMLKLAGYYTGAIDGIRGALQEAAEAKWAQDEYAAKQEFGVFDERSERNIATLLPAAQRVARAWMSKAKPEAEKAGFAVKIICGTRTYAEQDALYAQGRTKKGAKVTNARGGYSWHNFGLAFDFGVFTPSGKTYFGNSKMYKELGRLAVGMKNATWGGTWKNPVDEPHIQLDMFSSTRKAREKFNAM